MAAAAAAAAAAAEGTRIELQTELNAGRQRIGAAEKARLELEVCSDARWSMRLWDHVLRPIVLEAGNAACFGSAKGYNAALRR